MEARCKAESIWYSTSEHDVPKAHTSACTRDVWCRVRERMASLKIYYKKLQWISYISSQLFEIYSNRLSSFSSVFCSFNLIEGRWCHFIIIIIHAYYVCNIVLMFRCSSHILLNASHLITYANVRFVHTAHPLTFFNRYMNMACILFDPRIVE